MRVIIGYGNKLRGEDAFGVDVIEKVRELQPKKTKLLSILALTPEIVLELLDAEEIIFVDAAYDMQDHYALACSLAQGTSHLSHHILPETIIAILNDVYKKYPAYKIYSMITDSFDEIEEKQRYLSCIKDVVREIYRR